MSRGHGTSYLKIKEVNVPKKEQKIESGQRKPSQFGIPFFTTFILTFSIWLLLSGRFDAFHVGLGVISCGIISVSSGRMIFGGLELKHLVTIAPRFVAYIPWLLYQIFLANIHVMKLVFHPRMMDLIDPRIIKFKSRLKSNLALTTFANSITLTPGTITIYVTDFGDFEVHVIDAHSGKALPGDMEQRIAKIFR